MLDNLVGDDGVEIDRRGFLKVSGGVAMLAASSGGVSAQLQAQEPFDDVAMLIGPKANRPDPQGSFFTDKTRYHYIYWVTDDSGRYEITHGDSSWSLIPGTRQRLFDSLTADQTVTNTTTETTVFNPMLEADGMVTGDVYELPLTGTYTTANSTEQFTLRFHLGSTEVASVTSVQANVSQAPWYATLTFTVRSTGASGAVKPHVVAAFDNVHDDQHAAVTTLDTTVDETFSVTVQWDEQNAGDEVLVGQAYLKRVGTVT